VSFGFERKAGGIERLKSLTAPNFRHSLLLLLFQLREHRTGRKQYVVLHFRGIHLGPWI
jgi:hypothetical protein